MVGNMRMDEADFLIMLKNIKDKDKIKFNEIKTIEINGKLNPIWFCFKCGNFVYTSELNKKKVKIKWKWDEKELIGICPRCKNRMIFYSDGDKVIRLLYGSYNTGRCFGG